MLNLVVIPQINLKISPYYLFIENFYLKNKMKFGLYPHSLYKFWKDIHIVSFLDCKLLFFFLIKFHKN